MLKIVIVVVLLFAAAVAGAAVVRAGGLRELFADDPARADYTWLRRELSQAEKLAREAVQYTRRSGNEAAAAALAQAIRSSRASARRGGTESIPDGIREALQDYFPQEVLEEVRWSFPNRDLDLGSLVAWYKAEGGAVTLQDTIVYAGRSGLESEYLWAHELTHVMQYRELGLNDFARLYATHPELLERQARKNGNRIVADLRARRAAAPAAAR